MMKSHQNIACYHCPAYCSSILSNSSQEELDQVFLKKTVQFYRKGETIFHQDTPCFGIHCIESGIVKLFTQEYDGKEIINRLSCAGDVLGHSSVFGEQKYIEGAKALEDTSCCFIETTHLKELFLLMPHLSAQLMGKIGHELFESHLRNANMVRKNVRERLAEYFLNMSDRMGHESENKQFFAPHLSREEIASYIGSAHETVIRCISEFKELGYIKEENKVFCILDRPTLAKLADQELLMSESLDG